MGEAVEGDRGPAALIRLLADHVDPTGVTRVIDEVLTHVYNYPRTVAEKIAPVRASFGTPCTGMASAFSTARLGWLEPLDVRLHRHA